MSGVGEHLPDYPVGVNMDDIERRGRPRYMPREEPELDEEEWLGED